jgi:LysR family transcriptional regulator, carnitine catabolism transcriptional activator
MNQLPDLSVRHLRAIVAVSRAGKFVAAASELGMYQLGLSRLVQQSEEFLSVRLFTRGARTTAPTSAGRLFIPAAERLLNELQQQVAHIRTLDSELHGQLTVSCLMSLCHHVVPGALIAFRREHSQIHIRVHGCAALVPWMRYSVSCPPA